MGRHAISFSVSPRHVALVVAAVAVLAGAVYLFVQVRSTPAAAQVAPPAPRVAQTERTPEVAPPPVPAPAKGSAPAVPQPAETPAAPALPADEQPQVEVQDTPHL